MPGDVVSGQKIGGNLSAGDWNRMRAHLARTEPPKGFGVPRGNDESAGDGIALVKNSSSEPFAPGEVVGLESPEFTASDDENTVRNNLHFKGAVPTSDHTGKFGVVLNGLAADGTAPAQIHGLCWAKLNMTAEGDAFADIEADTKTLKSGGSGAAQILYAFPKGTEYPQETVGYVRIGNMPIPTPLKGKLDETLNFEGEATVSIWAWNTDSEVEEDTGENIDAFDWLLESGQTVASGNKVIIEYISGYYYVTGAACDS